MFRLIGTNTHGADVDETFEDYYALRSFVADRLAHLPREWKTTPQPTPGVERYGWPATPIVDGPHVECLAAGGKVEINLEGCCVACGQLIAPANA